MRWLLQLISILSGYVVVVYTLIAAGSRETSNVDILYNIVHKESFIFVGSILIGVILLSYGVIGVMTIIRSFFILTEGGKTKNKNFLKNSKSLAEAYYKDKLGGVNRKALPKIWKTILKNIERKVPLNDIKEIITYEGRNKIKELTYVAKIFRNLSNISSSIGILGTIIGLIKLFRGLQDFSSLGDNMALAFITTFYGVLFSVVIFTPIMIKIESNKEEIKESYSNAYFWLDIVENRKPISYLEISKQ